MKSLYTYVQRWGVGVLLVVLASPLFAQTGTLTFTSLSDVNLGQKVYDAQSYSTDVSSVQIDMFNAQTEPAAAARIPIGSFVYFTPSSISMQKGSVFSIDIENSLSINIAPPPYWVVMSHDGSEFSFKGIRISDPAASQTKTLIQSYRDGVLIGSVTLEMTSPSYEQLYENSSFPSNSFGNIDELRISNMTTNDPTFGNYGGFNDFVFGAVVLPPSLNVSTTTLPIGAPANSTAQFDITSNVSWSVSSSETWLEVSPLSGSNNGTVTLKASPNTAHTTRQATVTVSGVGVADKEVTVTQAIPTSIVDVSESVVTFYPNPVDGELSLRGVVAKEVVVVNLAGEVVAVKSVVSGKSDLSSLAPGIYMVKIAREGEEPILRKIVKK